MSKTLLEIAGLIGMRRREEKVGAAAERINLAFESKRRLADGQKAKL